MNTQLNSSTTTIRPGIDYEAFSRYLELVQHAVDTGVPLALSPAAIMAIEDAGGIVAGRHHGDRRRRRHCRPGHRGSHPAAGAAL